MIGTGEDNFSYTGAMGFLEYIVSRNDIIGENAFPWCLRVGIGSQVYNSIQSGECTVYVLCHRQVYIDETATVRN